MHTTCLGPSRAISVATIYFVSTHIEQIKSNLVIGCRKKNEMQHSDLTAGVLFVSQITLAIDTTPNQLYAMTEVVSNTTVTASMATTTKEPVLSGGGLSSMPAKPAGAAEGRGSAVPSRFLRSSSTPDCNQNSSINTPIHTYTPHVSQGFSSMQGYAARKVQPGILLEPVVTPSLHSTSMVSSRHHLQPQTPAASAQLKVLLTQRLTGGRAASLSCPHLPRPTSLGGKQEQFAFTSQPVASGPCPQLVRLDLNPLVTPFGAAAAVQTVPAASPSHAASHTVKELAKHANDGWPQKQHSHPPSQTAPASYLQSIAPLRLASHAMAGQASVGYGLQQEAQFTLPQQKQPEPLQHCQTDHTRKESYSRRRQQQRYQDEVPPKEAETQGQVKNEAHKPYQSGAPLEEKQLNFQDSSVKMQHLKGKLERSLPFLKAAEEQHRFVFTEISDRCKVAAVSDPAITQTCGLVGVVGDAAVLNGRLKMARVAWSISQRAVMQAVAKLEWIKEYEQKLANLGIT